ncbi:fumarylacetoacetate hydrolase family protein [Methylobacterium sp. ARG-1]|uniref:fumarylacetoacetate hydrolase family protein n=1 Tax=Methylobacterium sp. ARG-1 TaxID=1692501 RepID=UPI00067FB092|nr:fumarylacetoacetate hydrolase family protein [Methylobacterium sp. ARG-1]KNY19106.1 hypothetical protein AKJ13_29545 [Methylobacterium sp. ARG-1]
MKFATIRKDSRAGIAVSDGGSFHVLFEGDRNYPGTIVEALQKGLGLNELAAIVLAGPQLDVNTVDILPPIANPPKIICIGLNYRDHAEEVGMAIPDYPTVFTRFASSLIGDRAAIVKPGSSDQLDFEAELAVIIGKGGRRIPKAAALSHVAGYSVFNDATLRDYQFRTTQWTVGKNFDSTGPFGPYLVSADALPPGCRGLRISARLNGQTVQDSNIDELIFDIETLVSLLSETFTLQAGDVIITGTPAGVGVSRKPQLFMKPGDMVEVEIDGIGVLRNHIVAE